jgi:hypothetical protein
MFMGSAGPATAAAAVACTAVVAGARDSSSVDARVEDVSATAVGDEAADVGAALDVAEEMDEELVADDDVTTLEVAGAALELEIDEDAVLEIAADDTALDTASDDTTLDIAADEAWDTEATVCNVVAEFGAAAALLGNDPSPQRHEQAQEPSAFVVPVPLAMAPGDPTAGAAARRLLVSIRKTSWKQHTSLTSRGNRR